MRQRIVLFLVMFFTMFFTQCEYPTLCDEEVGSLSDYRSKVIDDNIHITSSEDIRLLRWGQLNRDVTFKYKTDMEVHGVEEYWQTPEETYKLGSGDCEDYALLYAYLLITQLKLKVFVMCSSKGDRLHLQTGFIEDEKLRYFDPGGNIHGSPWPVDFKTDWIISYEQAMYMTIYYHQPVGTYCNYR